MGRKRTVVEEPPIEAVAADEGFDKAPEFDFDDTPETPDDSGDYGC